MTTPPFPLNSRQALICFLLVASTTTLAAPQNANTASKKTVSQDEEPITLEPMEVTSASVGRGSKVENMDVSTTVLSREQIQHSPELTLDAILSQQMGVIIPNVPQNQTDPTGATVSMRGSAGGEKVLVMVDGVPMNDGYFRTIDWSQIPKDTIDKVEIIRGGGGAALWGNLAMGGVINIITKAPVAGEKRIGFAYGNLNTKVGDAAMTVFSNDRIQSGFNFNVIESDGYNTSPKFDRVTPNLVSSATRTHNGLWSTYFTPNEHSKYFFKLAGSELLQDQITYSTANNQWYKLDVRSGGKTDYSKTGSFNFSGFYDYSQMNKANGALLNISPGKGPSYTSQTGGGVNLLTGANVATSGVMSGQIESMNYSSYGASGYIEDRLSLNNWGSIDDIKIGIDARGVTTTDANNLYAQNGTKASSSGKFSTDTALLNSASQFATYNMQGQTLFEGVFAQGTYKPKGIPLEATLGLREDLWQAIAAKQSQIYQTNPAIAVLTPTSNSYQSPGNQTFNQIDPRFGLKYSFDSGIDLRSAVYRNFAAPGMNQLYRTYASASSAAIGNASLIPETSFGQEVGIDFKGKNVKTTFTAYHSQIDNYINATSICALSGGAQQCTPNVLSSMGLANTPYSGVTKNLNIGSVTTEGAELFGQWNALDTLQVNASAIYTHAVLDNFNNSTATMNTAILKTAGNQPLLYTGRQLPNIPIMMFTQGGSWNIRSDLTFSWAIKTWPTYPASTLNVATVNGNGKNNGAATTADLHMSYRPIKMLELYMNVQNVADAYYNSQVSTSSSGASVLGMPRTYLGGFKLSF
jgi:outer membrane receptor protein involved in Fe transport